MPEDTASIFSDELERARRILAESSASAQVRRQIDAKLCRGCSIKLIEHRGRDAWRRWFQRLLARYNRTA
jgi:hypothetical protein